MGNLEGIGRMPCRNVSILFSLGEPLPLQKKNAVFLRILVEEGHQEDVTPVDLQAEPQLLEAPHNLPCL